MTGRAPLYERLRPHAGAAMEALLNQSQLDEALASLGVALRWRMEEKAALEVAFHELKSDAHAELKVSTLRFKGW